MRYVAKPCRTERAYEVIPEMKMNIEVEHIAERLERHGYSIVIKTPHIVVIRKEFEVSVYPSGRILIKKVDDKEVAEKIADEIYGVLS